MKDLPAIRATLGEVAWLAAAYSLAGKIGLLLDIPLGYATAIWPPSGIALAELLLRGYRLWPGVVQGSFYVNIATSFDPSGGWSTARSLILALVIGGGGGAEALVGAVLVQRCVKHGVLLPGTVLLQRRFTPTALAQRIRQTLDDRVPEGVVA